VSQEGKRHLLTPEELKTALYGVVQARIAKAKGRRPTGYVQLELLVSPDDPQLVLGAKLWCTAKPWGKHPVKV
jgi:hypothetical protein